MPPPPQQQQNGHNNDSNNETTNHDNGHDIEMHFIQISHVKVYWISIPNE